jgi:hypothetical protein
MISLAEIRQVDHAGFFILRVLQIHATCHEGGVHRDLGAFRNKRLGF